MQGMGVFLECSMQRPGRVVGAEIGADWMRRERLNGTAGAEVSMGQKISECSTWGQGGTQQDNWS